MICITHRCLKSIFEDLNLTQIPFSDVDVWSEYPEYHQLYNKLWVAETQGLPCGPMGIYPQTYPVIFKPIINLFGMSRGVIVINSDSEYRQNLKDGFFWSKFLVGTHRCIDLIVKDGTPVFYSSLISYPAGQGAFDYHESDPDYEIPECLTKWIKTFLDDYTGCVNIETINDTIIEIHLRLNGDTHLYNQSFATELDKFLRGESDKINYIIPKIYIIPLFVNPDYNKEIDRSEIHKICIEYEVVSIYFDSVDSEYQSEHKARLLIFDIDNIKRGLECRKKIFDII